MNLTIHKLPKPGALRLEGEFSFSSQQAFQEATQDLADDPDVREISLDLSGLSHLDSSALGMLLILRERAKASQKQVILLNPPSQIAGLLRSVSFGKLFQIRTGG
jgi:anti-anti-sigma factor